MSNIDYKQKAQKYKMKYIKLKNSMNLQNGGGNQADWYPKFSNELANIYASVDDKYGDGEDNKVIFTGSGVIAYILKYLEMNDVLDTLTDINLNPHDLDFVYDATGKSRTIKQSPENMTIGGTMYNIRGGKNNCAQSKVHFDIDETNNSNYIKSFDVTKNKDGSMKTFELNKMRMINLEDLKSKYEDPDFAKQEASKQKIILIDQIIAKIKLDGRESEFGFGSKPEPEDSKSPKKRSRGLFASFFGSDDESDNEHSPPRPMGSLGDYDDKQPMAKNLFGDYSDDEEENQKPTNNEHTGGYQSSDNESTIRPEDLEIS